MRLLLDTDVLMDVATGRQPWGPASKEIVRWCHDWPSSAFVAWHTVANIHYLLRPVRGEAETRAFLGSLLDFTAVAPVGTDAVRYALTLKLKDFEDALQVAAASAAQAQFIVTRNTVDYRPSLIPAISPEDFIRRFLDQ